MRQPTPTTEPDSYEVKLLPDNSKGKLVERKILRPETYKFAAALDLLTQDFVVALTVVPSAGDPVYPEPVVVFVKFQLIESFIKGVLSAQGLGAAEERKGGTV